MGHADPVGGSNPQQQTPRVIPFGKYLLLDRLAVGGMAEVYTAKSFGIEGFEKIIAIKRILPTMAEDDDFITMFIDEAKIAGHLTHANVVPIYELGKIGESHYIAMEYVWGKDLLQIMNRFRRMRRHMPPVMAAWIASKILEGLDYAHRKRDRHGRPMGIIHRDVSPQNCLVSYEGQVKLIDFGIAKAASRNTKTQAGVLKGKFGYMSPEQVRGLPIDHRSDIFAASTCLHEMLTGERLFVGESDFSTLEKVRNADVMPPSQRVAEIPKELEEIVLKGLSREPDDRWQTAGEMQEELQRFIALSRPPFGTSKLNTWMRTAFAPELAKEKARLDMFSNVSHPGGPGVEAPRPPAAAPAPPPPPSRAPASFDVPDDIAELAALEDEDDFGGEATMVTASPFDAMEEANAAGGEADELPEQPTQIFFTADDLEEIDDDDSPPATAPAGSLSSPAPAPAAQMPPPQAVGSPASAPVGTPAPQPAGGVPRSTMQLPSSSLPGAPPQASMPQPQPQPTPGQANDMFAPPPPGGAPPGGAPAGRQRNLPTMEVDRPGQLKPAKKKGGMGKWIAILGVAAVLFLVLTVGGAYVLFGESTGTVEVRVSPAEADAVVFVDGVQRGRAPLMLEHVPEGTHTIEVRADGYESSQQELEVASGSNSVLQLPMQPESQVVVANAPATPTETTPAETAAAEAEEAEAEAEEAEAEAEEAVAEEEEEEAEAEEPERVASADRTPRRTPREESRTPRRAPRERAPRRGGSTGTLTINSMPWARVFVDGRDTGRNTPVRNLSVPAGSHTIGLRTNDGVMHNVPVTVVAGQNHRIVRQF